MRRKSYRATGGGLTVVDAQQTKRGSIVPNVAIDLYLPIIGAEGLGVWALLLRQAALPTWEGEKGVVQDGLKRLASACRMGYPAFIGVIDLLTDLGVISVEKPVGNDRANHKNTIIKMLETPTSIAPEHQNMVVQRGINTRFVDTCELLPSNSHVNGFSTCELLGSNSIELLPSNSIHHGNHGNHHADHGFTQHTAPDHAAVLSHDSGDIPGDAPPHGDQDQPGEVGAAAPHAANSVHDTRSALAQADLFQDGSARIAPGSPPPVAPPPPRAAAATRKRKAAAPARSTVQQAIKAAWFDLGSDDLPLVRPETGKDWKIFWGQVAQLEERATANGWTAAATTAHIEACLRWLTKDKFWRTKPLTIVLLNSQMAAWWQAVEQPRLRAAASAPPVSAPAADVDEYGNAVGVRDYVDALYALQKSRPPRPRLMRYVEDDELEAQFADRAPEGP